MKLQDAHYEKDASRLTQHRGCHAFMCHDNGMDRHVRSVSNLLTRDFVA